MQGKEDSIAHEGGSTECTDVEMRPWHHSTHEIGGFTRHPQVVTERIQARKRVEKGKRRLRDLVTIASPHAVDNSLASALESGRKALGLVRLIQDNNDRIRAVRATESSNSNRKLASPSMFMANPAERSMPPGRAPSNLPSARARSGTSSASSEGFARCSNANHRKTATHKSFMAKWSSARSSPTT